MRGSIAIGQLTRGEPDQDRERREHRGCGQYHADSRAEKRRAEGWCAFDVKGLSRVSA